MFQTLAIASSASGTGIFLSIPCKDVASRLFFACHALTKGRGFHIVRGGPTMLMNMSDEMCETVICERSDVQISFIWLKPLSQAAVLTA